MRRAHRRPDALRGRRQCSAFERGQACCWRRSICYASAVGIQVMLHSTLLHCCAIIHIYTHNISSLPSTQGLSIPLASSVLQRPLSYSKHALFLDGIWPGARTRSQAWCMCLVSRSAAMSGTPVHTRVATQPDGVRRLTSESMLTLRARNW